MSIDLRLGSPRVWEYMVGGEPQTWWRVPVHNRKDPVDLTVRVTGIDPEVRLIVPDCRLHRTGDDAPDEKYAGETRLKHNEEAWFDVITACDAGDAPRGGACDGRVPRRGDV